MGILQNFIRENKLQQIKNIILNNENQGIRLMDYSIRDFYQQGLITYDIAISNPKNPKLVAEN